jgi:hypothetical protein
VRTTIRIRAGTTEGNVLATISSLVHTPMQTGAQPLGYFEFLEPLSLTPGSPYIIEWLPPGDALLTWMAIEGNPYVGGTAFGCTNLAIENEDYVFATYRARMPLTKDQISEDETGLSRGCGTPSAGHLFQTFQPSASDLTAIDLRLRVGGNFPNESDAEMTTMILIRPAEQATDSLDIDGWIRAEQLSHVLLKARVSAVYASTAIGAQQTVNRFSNLRGLEPSPYSDKETLAQKILNDHKGEVTLVVGDQGTVPELIDLLGGKSSSCKINSEYDNLCLVTIFKDGDVNVIQLQYGNSSP